MIGLMMLDTLVDALESGDLDRARHLVNENPDLVHAADDEGQTALHLVAAAGAADLVSLLLARGAAANVQDVYWTTPLHYAATSGDVAAVRALLEAGADPNAADEDGFTPLNYAALAEQREIGELLVERGAEAREDVFDDSLTHGHWKQKTP